MMSMDVSQSGLHPSGVAQPLATPSEGPAELLARMRAGDREAAAEFVTRFGSRLLRRIRTKLSQPMRRVFDSLDILSTLARRLDHFVHSGQLEAATEDQLWSLLFRMAEHAVIDKARVFRRLQSAEGEDSTFAREMLARLQAAEVRRRDGPEVELERAMQSLQDRVDRTILSLWLLGTPHIATAEWVGLTPAAVRQRWHSIRTRLRATFEADS